MGLKLEVTQKNPIIVIGGGLGTVRYLRSTSTSTELYFQFPREITVDREVVHNKRSGVIPASAITFSPDGNVLLDGQYTRDAKELYERICTKIRNL